MKTTINKPKPKPKPEFPKLAQSSANGYIVLFNAPGVGIVVAEGKSDAYPIGHYSNSWQMHAFETFTGSLTLEN